MQSYTHPKLRASRLRHHLMKHLESQHSGLIRTTEAYLEQRETFPIGPYEIQRRNREFTLRPVGSHRTSRTRPRSPC